MHWFNGKLRFFVNNYNGANSYVEATIPTGSWSHVAGTYDGAALKLYVNGVLAATANYSTPIVHSAQPLQIGRGGGNSFYWKGGLDEVAVYGTALTGGQVQSHYLRARPWERVRRAGECRHVRSHDDRGRHPQRRRLCLDRARELLPGQYSNSHHGQRRHRAERRLPTRHSWLLTPARTTT